MSAQSSEDWASDRLVHGLLSVRAERASGAGAARLERSLAHLRESRQSRSASVPRFGWRGLLAAAAGLVGVLLLARLAFDSNAAYALLEASVAAERDSFGARHHWVAYGTDASRAEVVALEGQMDLLGERYARFDARSPDGRVEVHMGRTPNGSWMRIGAGPLIISGDDNPGAASLDHSAEMLASPGAFLELLGRTHDLEVLPLAEGFDGPRLLATRRHAHDQEPAEVELWLDPETSRAMRLELRWEARAAVSMEELHREVASSLTQGSFLYVLPRLAAGTELTLTRLVLVRQAAELQDPKAFEPDQNR
ncbi:MAG: hypothetical protein ACI8QC_004102 [Planctomycetota bacterium]|jgi:hypothetical protein